MHTGSGNHPDPVRKMVAVLMTFFEELGEQINNQYPRFLCIIIIIIIIIISIISVFNTDALLPYNHDLFESLIVKKRIRVDREGTQY
ncbi:hypothetical protein CSKR_102903 [Clonorchis sinensis]|uniref:Uncharacterized protein n=1 Tax=Clonorchis sinensis TaxID=79923 RepID=A0A3R7CE54_CLOSI|nr:hypothetical protein CSKR_102903 [Clonorchis sinensis]